MTGTNDMIIFYETTQIVDGVEQPKLVRYITNTTLAPFAVRAPHRPGIGKPFWAFPTAPQLSTIAGWTFEGAPIATAFASTNAQLIAAITATPADVFVFVEAE